MSTSREKRNLLKSLKTYLNTCLTADGWTNVVVEPSFMKVYDIPLVAGGGIINYDILSTTHNNVEIGSTNTYRETLIILRICTKLESTLEDLSDYLVGKIKKGFNFYEYSKVSGVETGTLNGKVTVQIITDQPVSFNTEKTQLDEHDRFRYEISFRASRGVVES